MSSVIAVKYVLNVFCACIMWNMYVVPAIPKKVNSISKSFVLFFMYALVFHQVVFVYCR